MKGLTFTIDEKKTAIELARKLTESMSELANGSDRSNVLRHIKAAMGSNAVERDVFGLNPIVSSLQTAAIAVDEIGLKRDGVLAILLMNGIMLPLYYRFGPEKARMLYMLMFAGMGAMLGGGIALMDAFSGASAAVLVSGLLAAALVLYAVSWRVSVAWYGKYKK